MASRTRRNAEENEEYMANILATVEFQEFMEEMNEASEHALFWSKSTMQRQLRLLDKFITFHCKSPTLALYADKIFSVDSLTNCCCSYLTMHVQVSQASVRKGSDGSAERMSWPSLKTIRDDVLALIINFCPDATRELIDEWTERLNSHCQHLVETYSMVKTQRPKQYWGPPELRLLIEQGFKNIVHPSSRRSLDMILQHIFLWTLLLMTGCRPGSLLSNRVYPNEYMRYKHLSLRRTTTRGQFDLLINIVSWKGGHTNRPYSCTFTIRAVMVEHMLELDAATQLIAIALRRQAFRDHTTLESLLDGTEYIVKWHDKLLDESVLQGSVPGGGSLVPGSILNYNGARLFMKAIAADSTLGGSIENAVLYGFRRAAASVLQLCFGSETAKGILHHRVKSDTLNETYSNVHQTADTSGAILEKRTAYSTQTTLQNAPALHRSMRTEPIKPLSLEEAVSSNDHLKGAASKGNAPDPD
ncbi:hypothetical protein EDD18DRAFT_1361292 [Armillaria luteobubalina]|uniref:Uncharacterized protein n=1 Tax=Armillaria luteobubalina TaxID=153913 RepID=A0AA39PHE4_9AGAR|nr:hypothetical protein EDD18DRAFT_1361292 [Armillaria luteobubalina]